MPVTSGLVLGGYRSLAEVCAPLAAELARCFWVVDIQSGPFDSLWLYETEENEALVDRQFWEVSAFANSGTNGFRPGTIPTLADRMIIDEYSYYFAIDGPEPEALVKATALAPRVGDFSEQFLRSLGEFADLFICHVDGWWEFYTGRPEWFHRLRSAWPDCFERDLSLAGESPSTGRPA